MQEKVVEFQDKQGRKMVGSLIVPESNRPFPAVIVCHGFKGDRNEFHIKAIAEEISKKGVITLRFDFVKNPGESSLPFEDMTVSYEIEVLDQAVNFLKSLPEVNTDRIGITGHSLGGLVASWYVAKHPEIKSLVCLSAVYSFNRCFSSLYKDWLEEARERGSAYIYSSRTRQELKLSKAFWDDGVTYEMDKVIEDINCPVMVLCGTSDELLSHSQNYFDRLVISNKALKIIKGANHNYDNAEHINQVKLAVADWFEKTLTIKH